LGIAIDLRRCSSKAIRRAREVLGTRICTCVFGDDSGCARLRSRGVPGVLKTQIGIDGTARDAGPRAAPLPKALPKLQFQLRVPTVFKFGNNQFFARIKVRAGIINSAQRRKGYRNNHAIV
jgi:hypothetical protein